MSKKQSKCIRANPPGEGGSDSPQWLETLVQRMATRRVVWIATVPEQLGDRSIKLLHEIMDRVKTPEQVQQFYSIYQKKMRESAEEFAEADMVWNISAMSYLRGRSSRSIKLWEDALRGDIPDIDTRVRSLLSYFDE